MSTTQREELQELRRILLHHQRICQVVHLMDVHRFRPVHRVLLQRCLISAMTAVSCAWDQEIRQRADISSSFFRVHTPASSLHSNVSRRKSNSHRSPHASTPLHDPRTVVCVFSGFGEVNRGAAMVVFRVAVGCCKSNFGYVIYACVQHGERW